MTITEMLDVLAGLQASSSAPKMSQVYRHYQGNLYSVVGYSFTEDDNTLLINYSPYNDWSNAWGNAAERVTFSRPYNEWNQEVSEGVKRFTRVVKTEVWTEVE